MPEEAEASSAGKPRLRVVNRAQFVLRPMDIEELIGEEHSARALWEFTGRLDLAKFHEPLKAVEGRAGQPGNDPRLMLALWLYAYSRGIGSAREVARQCEYEPGFQWLCALDPINHHSLSDFRVDFNEALTELFTQVLGVLSAEGLITLERVAHDGTRVRAAASANTFRSEKTLREHLELAREQVKEMGDPTQPPTSPRKAGAQKRARREREEKLVAALEQLEQVRKDRRNENRSEARASETDPEARVMKRSGGGFEPSYNLQISTDAAAGLIVGLHVTQGGGDAPYLQPAIERIKQSFGKVPGQLLADGGYTSSENIVALHDQIEFIGPLQIASEARMEGQRKRNGVAKEFTADHFVFVKELNSFRCPAGQMLVYHTVDKAPSGLARRYHAKSNPCQVCAFKPQCCPKTKVREIRVVEEAPEIKAFRKKMEEPEMIEIYKKRSQLAEFPHAWLKEKIGLRRFRVRGLRKVTLESLWAAMTYNIQQWIRLKWRQPKPLLA